MLSENPASLAPDAQDPAVGKNLIVFDFDSAREAETWARIFQRVPALASDLTAEWDQIMLADRGLKNRVGSVIMESQYVCKDHRNLHSNFFSKKFSETDPNCCRLHFFADRLNGRAASTPQILAALGDEKYRKSYIGYAVIRPAGHRVIGRTILNPALMGQGVAEHHYCLTADFKVHLAGTTLVARGYPYISQDSESMVCAHSAIWGACRYLSQRYQVYRELYPYDIIIYTNPQRGRVVPYRGMTYNDYSDILTRFGCHPVLLDDESREPESVDSAKAEGKGKEPSPPAKTAQERAVSEVFRQVYAYIESGFPVLASNQRHVLTLIGHTLPKPRVAPKPNKDGYIFSSQYLDALIAMDDNRFPYERLTWAPSAPEAEAAAKVDSTPTSPRPIYLDDLKHFVVPLPEKVFLQAKHAEDILMTYVENAGIFSDEMQARLDKERKSATGLVIRQFVTTCSALKEEALRRFKETKSGIFTEIIDRPMPHFIWVMELASAEGYAHGKCLGEIVIDATASAWSLNSLLFMRVEHFAFFDGAQIPFDNRTPFEPCSQFSHNLGAAKGI